MSRRHFVLLGLGGLAAAWVLFAVREDTQEGPEERPIAQAPAIERHEPVVAPTGSVSLVPASANPDDGLEHGAIVGRVISWGDGSGVARAEVIFAHEGATHSVQSGEDGTFELAAPEPGLYELAVVTAEGFVAFAPAWGHSPVVFSSRPGQRIADVTIRLTPAIVYRGSVESPDGALVAGAVVTILRETDPSLVPRAEPVTTGADGRFELVAPDFALVEATHPTFGPGRARIDFAVQVSHELRIRLAPKPSERKLGSIGGRVVTADDQPATSALVAARLAGNPGLPSAQLAPRGRDTADAEGAFLLEGLDPGTHALTARAPGHGPSERTLSPTGARDVVLRLTRGLALTGTVRDAGTREPVPSFTLLLSPAGGNVRALSVLDASGQYRVNDLGAGPYRVRVASYGYAMSDAASITLDAAQRESSVLDFELTQGGRLHGVVIDEVQRTPVEGARVSTEGGVRAQDVVLPVAVSTLTDANGRFEVRGVASGLRSLVVTAVGHHGRIISGLEVEEDGSIGPLNLALMPVAEGEQPRLELTGIGAVLSRSESGLVVGDTLAGGGAREAGLAPGDIILAIDGRPVAEIDFREAIEMIRGIEGSSLSLKIRKADSGDEIVIETTRRRVGR